MYSQNTTAGCNPHPTRRLGLVAALGLLLASCGTAQPLTASSPSSTPQHASAPPTSGSSASSTPSSPASSSSSGSSRPSSCAPTLAAVSPVDVTPGGELTFMGSCFGQRTGTVQLLPVGPGSRDITLTVTGWSQTAITARVPLDAPEGTWSPDVVSAAGLTAGPSSDAAFPQVVIASVVPTVSSLTPRSVVPGGTITIEGTDLGAAPGGVSAAPNGNANAAVPLTSTSWSPTRITVTVPTIPAGSYTILVTTRANLVANAGAIEVGS